MEEIDGLKLQSQLLPDVDQKALNKLACEKSRKDQEATDNVHERFASRSNYRIANVDHFEQVEWRKNHSNCFRK